MMLVSSLLLMHRCTRAEIYPRHEDQDTGEFHRHSVVSQTIAGAVAV